MGSIHGQYSKVVDDEIRSSRHCRFTFLHFARSMTGIARDFTFGVAFMIFERMECMAGENGGVRMVFGELSLVLAKS